MKITNNSKRTILGLLIAGAISASSASAATIVAYYKIDNGDDDTSVSSDTDAFSTAGSHVFRDVISSTSTVALNWNTTYEALGAVDNANSVHSGASTLTETSFAAAQTANDYNSFSLTIGAPTEPNDMLDLETYAFHYGAVNSTSPNQFQLTYQLNGSGGFAAVGSAISLPQNTGATLNLVEVDLSSIPLLIAGDSVQFRLYGWGATATDGDIRWGEQVLVGTYVPEPSSFALLAGFLGLTWVMLRRRA